MHMGSCTAAHTKIKLCLPAFLLAVAACRDSDSEDRNFSPVMLSGGGVTDLAITAMDQGWCMQAYTCQKRLS
jgi:hypothetical protein